jgi:branched-chain amino acid transport system permease protein
MLLQFAEVLIFGTVQGSVLAILALGFSLVYGVGGILNIGHGAFYLVTCYILYVCVSPVWWGLPLIVSIIISLVVVLIIGAISYLLLMEPLQESHLAVIMVTFAFAFFLEQVVKIMVDTKTHAIPPFISGSVEILGVSFIMQNVFVIVGSLVSVFLVGLFIGKTKIGKSIRAVSQDREAAMLMGINAKKILLITVMISALLAGIAGVLYGPADAIAPHIGWRFLISAFAVTIFGGMGSISGSIVGAFIMGYAKMFCMYFIGPEIATIFPLLVIAVMLLVRPQGLLGKKEVK